MHKFFVFLIFPLYANAIDIHTRHTVGSMSPSIAFGDTCNKTGRMVYVRNIDPRNDMGVAVCKQTSGYSPQQFNYVIPKNTPQKKDGTSAYIGCTVEGGISTGYNVIWWDPGGYVPSSIMNAQESIVLELSRKLTHQKPPPPPEYVQVLLTNPNQSRGMVVNYTTPQNITETVNIDKHDSINFLNGYRLNWVKYAYEYNGQLVCNW